MSALRKYQACPVEDYLSNPLYNERPHEFVDGIIVAMADPSDAHEIIAGNVFAELHQHLRKQQCRVFKGTRRLHVQFLNRKMFYYPDVMVVCKDTSRDERFKENAILVIEVLSPSTEGTDIREKMFAYLNSECVQHCVIIAQDKKEITIYRRTQPPEGWEVETLTLDDDRLNLPDLSFSMSLADVYENATLPVPTPL